MPDWEAIRERYARGDMSLRKLAGEYAVAYSTLYDRARRESWQRLSPDAGASEAADRSAPTLERLTDKLISRMEQAIDAGDMDTKDLKTMVGALRELWELVQQESGGSTGEGGSGGLQVHFIGEAEELSL